MLPYRITERGSHVIVGTEEEAILVCVSREVAYQAIADAKLLETVPARQIFGCRTMQTSKD